MDTPAAVPLHPTLVISILVSLTSLIPLLVTLLVMKVLVPILLSMGTRLKLQQYHFPLPVII
jgi:hypothetical protein